MLLRTSLYNFVVTFKGSSYIMLKCLAWSAKVLFLLIILCLIFFLLLLNKKQTLEHFWDSRNLSDFGALWHAVNKNLGIRPPRVMTLPCMLLVGLAPTTTHILYQNSLPSPCNAITLFSADMFFCFAFFQGLYLSFVMLYQDDDRLFSLIRLHIILLQLQ